MIIIMGIGDWAQSPIPNPHSQFLIKKIKKTIKNYYILIMNKCMLKYLKLVS